ncbi:FHA domain-containing protein [Rhizobium sp. LCM 4573]|uniref:SctD/MshK family protein n=1 Tax=Rhizobium sp. LCM 4573 TaxID=1848291 RepID=UPI0018E36CAF|nr:FHA domain-containing protein [Rhizobium sp. LCM 4573]
MSSNSLTFPSATALSPAIVATKPGALALDVLSGMHHGVRAPIDGEACTIGSSPSCDLVLSDRDIAQEHLQLRFYGRQVAINAIGGAVTVEGRPALQRGYGCRVKLPVTLTIGDAKLRIARDTPTGPMIKRWGPYAAAVAVALAMMPIVAVQAGISGLLPQKSALSNDQLTVGSVPAATAPSDGEIVGTLQQKIAEAGLGNLTLSADGRRIDVSGQVPPDRMEAWRDVQRWFDRSHGGRYVLTSLVSAAAVTDAPKFIFQAVFFGDNPYVVDARGERRYPGAALQDGWMLKSIEDGQILVVRGGQEFKLTL